MNNNFIQANGVLCRIKFLCHRGAEFIFKKEGVTIDDDSESLEIAYQNINEVGISRTFLGLNQMIHLKYGEGKFAKLLLWPLQKYLKLILHGNQQLKVEQLDYSAFHTLTQYILMVFFLVYYPISWLEYDRMGLGWVALEMILQSYAALGSLIFVYLSYRLFALRETHSQVPLRRALLMMVFFPIMGFILTEMYVSRLEAQVTSKEVSSEQDSQLLKPLRVIWVLSFLSDIAVIYLFNSRINFGWPQDYFITNYHLKMFLVLFIGLFFVCGGLIYSKFLGMKYNPSWLIISYILFGTGNVLGHLSAELIQEPSAVPYFVWGVVTIVLMIITYPRQRTNLK